MSTEYQVKRYAAFFRGWCQAFGEHESVSDVDSGIIWLFSQHQAGFILPQHLTRSLYREVLGKRGTPVLELRRRVARIGAFQYPLSGAADKKGIVAINTILEQGNDASLFLSSHFMYGTGTRIITLSNRKPLTIIYKEIGPMRVQLD